MYQLTTNQLKIFTEDYVINKIKKTFNNNYKLLSLDYHHQIIKLKCKKCNSIFKNTFSEFWSYNSRQEPCFNCRETNFKYRLFKKYGDNYTLVDKYKGGKVTTQFKCNSCGSIFDCMPDTLMYTNKGKGCKYCYGYKRDFTTLITKEKFLKRLKKLYPNGEFTLIGEYKGYTTETKFYHSICKQEFISRPDNLIMEKRKYCTKCSNNKSYDINDFKNKVKKITNNEYEVISDTYDNNKNKLIFKHNKCGREFKMSPNRFLAGNRCPLCIPNAVVTKKEFLKRFKAMPLSNEFEIVSKYKGSHNPIYIKHKKCGNIKKYVEAKSCLNNLTCSNCFTCSTGEAIISRFLKKYKINYKKEKTFKTCKFIGNLRFDFYIPNYKLLIEFDGQQHFYSSGRLTKQDLELNQKRDNIKNEWVKKHKNYKLIRIRYDQNIIKILNSIFIKNEIDDDEVFCINI